MNTAERLEFCLRDDEEHDHETKLRLIVNPNPLVDNSRLPVSCRYCELLDEYRGREIW